MLALFTFSPNYFLQIRVQFFSYTIVTLNVTRATEKIMDQTIIFDK